MELDLETSIKVNHFNIRLNTSYEYIVSVGENEKLLTYIPKHQANFGFKVNYQDVDLMYRHRFVGKVYTLTDNLAPLKGYQFGYLKLSYKFKFKTKRARAYLNLKYI